MYIQQLVAVKVVKQSVSEKMTRMELPKEAAKKNKSFMSLDDQIKAFEVTKNWNSLS